MELDGIRDNLALSIGKLFCLERSLLLSMTIIGGQFFGAFIGEMMFLAIRPSVSQAFPFVFLNESDIFVDRLPSSFQAVGGVFGIQNRRNFSTF